MTDAGEVARFFVTEFGDTPDGVWSAPGRLNLIGEHTDYNDGFVLPFVLPLRTWVAARRRPDGRVRVRSAQHPERPFDVSLDALEPGRPTGWAAYVAGILWALTEGGHGVGGMDVAVAGDVPPGAGLSSSAALECAVALAAVDLYGLEVRGMALARLAQRAENAFVGVPCGLMDQAVSLTCPDGRALFLDMRSGEGRPVGLPFAEAGLELVVVDTRAPHSLVAGEYERRRRECRRASERLGVASLREVSTAGLPQALGRLADEPVLARRVRHVVTENARVLAVVGHLDRGEPGAVGALLTASHASMRDDFAITVPEVDVACAALTAAGALGARMTGGGFGGCVLALAPAGAAPAMVAAVEAEYVARGFGLPAAVAARPSGGARREDQ